MASKRTSQERGQGSDDNDLQVPSKRRQGNPEQAETSTVMSSSNAMKEFPLRFESMLRKVMREVIPHLLQRHLTPRRGILPLDHWASTSGGRPLQLCFTNKLPQVIFTQSIVTAEGGVAIQIELRDAASQQRIVREEYSSVKIRICVLHGDFGSKGEEDWSAEEFNAQIVSPREGKGALLCGDTVITLKNGVGYIHTNIVFTDNSSSTRSKMFRLGVTVVQRNSIGADIREGRSEPFKVKDHRGVVYRKHDRPSLSDEVWRLKKIAKGGKRHEQLCSHEIKTVKDLLQLYITNQASLREKIGKIAEKSWDAIIAHAKHCDVDDDKLYIYYATEQSISLVFNCIYEVVEVTFNGQDSRSIQSLNSEEKRLVERVKQQAYNNLKDLRPLDATTHGLVTASTSAQTAQYGGPDQGLRQFGFPTTQQDPLNAYHRSLNLPSTSQPGTRPPTTATSQGDLVGTSDQLTALGESPPYWSVGGVSISGDDGVSQIDPFAIASCLFSPNPWEQANVNTFYLPCVDEAAEISDHCCFPSSTMCTSSRGTRNTFWHKIRSAVTWVRLHVARKKAQPVLCSRFH